jgi:hypothetical protein
VEIKKAISYQQLTLYCQFRLQNVTKPSSGLGKRRASKLRAAFSRIANQGLYLGREPLPAQPANDAGPLAALAG